LLRCHVPRLCPESGRIAVPELAHVSEAGGRPSSYSTCPSTVSTARSIRRATNLRECAVRMHGRVLSPSASWNGSSKYARPFSCTGKFPRTTTASSTWSVAEGHWAAKVTRCCAWVSRTRKTRRRTDLSTSSTLHAGSGPAAFPRRRAPPAGAAYPPAPAPGSGTPRRQQERLAAYQWPQALGKLLRRWQGGAVHQHRDGTDLPPQARSTSWRT
jgi:hypothetical protein